MNKVLFIIPFFGEFNNYFQLFLNSCKQNSDYNWLIITDNTKKYKYPSNVSIVHSTFEQMKKDIQKKFDFPISLDNSYKLCDYRPAYGYIFEEYLKDYDYWGHCDTDMIFGNISNFFSNYNHYEYDKIGFFGHFTLYKNNPEINQVFMKELKGIKRFQIVFTTKNNCSFDEEFNDSINNIFDEYSYKVLYKEFQANIYTKSSNFYLTRYDFNLNEYQIKREKNHLFVYKNGQIILLNKIDHDIKQQEFLYLHMQSRKMQMKLTDFSYYKLIPNSFENLVNNVFTENGFEKEKKKDFNLHYFRLRTKNLLIKCKRKLKKW